MKRWIALFLVILLPALGLAATGDILTKFGTVLTFKDSGGTYVFTVASTATVNGTWSAQANLGTTPQPSVYAWKCNARLQAADVLGEHVDFYLAWGDGTDIEGGTLITSSAGSLNAITVTTQLPNLHFLGSVYSDISSASVAHTAMGFTTIMAQYVSFVVFNATTKQMNTTANVSWCSLTQVFYEVQ